ncbi:MAG: cation diffusion facilitator family transporter [Pseudomonadota bacterium]
MLKLKDNTLIKSASYASVVIAGIILIIKIYGWVATESQSLLASLIDSFLDISSSLINLIAVTVALMPPDDNHRFGHDKFQDLAIFSQSIFFFASCLFMLFSSGRALYFGDAPENPEVGANAMYVCIFLTFVLVCYQSYVVKRTGSKIIAADKLHYFSDFLTNIVVVMSLYLSSSMWYIDAIAGIGIAIYIMHASYVLFRDAIRNLSDEEFSPEERKKIISVVREFDEAKGLHELKTRSAGSKPFIQFHLELDGSLSLNKAHEISDRIADRLMKEYPRAEIIIHQDPAGLEGQMNDLEGI